MKELTEKQKRYRDYAFYKIGFSPGKHLDLFQKTLSEMIKDKKLKKPFTFQDKVTSQRHTVEVEYNIIDWLQYELKFKEKKEWQIKEKTNKNSTVSATDLANFSFCPISFSISNSFETSPTSLMEVGIKEHKKSHLLEFKKRLDSIPNFKIEDEVSKRSFIIDYENKHFFDEIKHSDLIYSGHNENSSKSFQNKKKNYTGQPDYIFKNKEGKIFIVEEKFKYTKDNFDFAINHQIQTSSYIHGLDDFNPIYGYLIYWFYGWVSGVLMISSCKVLKIEKTEIDRKNLNHIYKQIMFLKNGGKVQINPSDLNLKKCVSCSLSKYCGHKTGRYDELEFPYNEKYLTLF